MFTPGSYRIWMHSLDVASVNQGPLSLNPVRWRELIERRWVINLKSLWHFWARLFLIRATCFIHNPTLLLSKHALHLLSRGKCPGYIQMLMWELLFGSEDKKTFGDDTVDCRLELLPVVGVWTCKILEPKNGKTKQKSSFYMLQNAKTHEEQKMNRRRKWVSNDSNNLYRSTYIKAIIYTHNILIFQFSTHNSLRGSNLFQLNWFTCIK